MDNVSERLEKVIEQNKEIIALLNTIASNTGSY